MPKLSLSQTRSVVGVNVKENSIINNMKISPKDIKQLELSMLQYIDTICKKNNLSYNLDYGTLLGAVRHKGFIPWDDDIDISMPREDYEKLIDIIVKDNSRYKILTSDTSIGYYYEFAKIVDSQTTLSESGVKGIDDMGVWVDVFPRDSAPRPYFIWKYIILFLVVMRVLAVQTKFPQKRSILFFPLWLIARVVGYKPFLSLSTKIVKSFPLKNRNKVGFLCDIVGNKALLWDKDVFDDKLLLPFEGNMYVGLRKYDQYLSVLYGDYMQLPPKEKRLVHAFDVYWKKDTIDRCEIRINSDYDKFYSGPCTIE